MTTKLVLIILTVYHCSAHCQSMAMDDYVLLRNEVEIKQRLSEVRRFMLPMQDDVFDQMIQQTARRYIPVQAESEECRTHSNHLLESVLRGDLWALKMVDASTKLVSGVLDGHLQDLGNYQQCISVEEPNLMFTGQHCIVETSGFLPQGIYEELLLNRYPYPNMDVIFAVCVPSSCSKQDVERHMDLSLAEINASTADSADRAKGVWVFDGGRITCTTSQPMPFRTKDYIVMFIFAMIAVTVIASTIYESHYGPKSVWSSFSLTSNFQILMDSKVSPGEISCLHGLRVILIISIIMAHRVCLEMVFPSFRYKTLLEKLGSLTIGIAETVSKSVDGFFLIGGTVLSYSFSRSMQKSLPFKILPFYLNRYFRITPLLVVAILVNATLFSHLSDGPLWPRISFLLEYPCTVCWWTGPLHISNYVMADFACVPQGWYLAADFQFYLIAPLFLLTLHKRPRLGVILLVVVSLISVVAATINAYVNKFYTGYVAEYFIPHRPTDMTQISGYKGIHLRIPDFLIGIALGHILFIAKQNEDISNHLTKMRLWLGWISCVVILTLYITVTKILVHPDHKYCPWLDPLYIGLSKPLYCASLSWIIFACALGYGGVVNSFLSWTVLRPFSRLSFGVFIMHEYILFKQIYTSETTTTFNLTDYSYNICGDVVWSFALATLVHVSVEVPFSRIATLLIRGKEDLTKIKSTNTKLQDIESSKK